MSKFYKFLVIAFAILCAIVTAVCIIPKNPFKEKGDEIVLLSALEWENESDFTVYEKNFAVKNSFTAPVKQGRKIDNYTFENRVIGFADAVYYREDMQNDGLLSSYYFSSGVILLRAEIPLSKLLSGDYYLNLDNNEIIEYCATYQYGKKEYSITLVKNSLEQGVYQLEYSKGVKLSSCDPTVKVSFFIKPNSFASKSGYLFELYNKRANYRKELSIGLNVIKEHANANSVSVFSNYLEI